ncbi:TonB-dependent receptor plug domain-containing protein [Psychroserpens sp. XS_ASV72]|uniref:TonB-dependent receptor n=1 Tax=Psychroserpens sp. XS_ASV72 TaxID=3241293 RepID=UPI003511A7E5
MLPTKTLVLLYFGLFCCFLSFGQSEQEKQPIVTVLNEISSIHEVTFNYESGSLDAIYVIPPKTDWSLNAKIKNLESQTKLVFSKLGESIIAISKIVEICAYLQDAITQEKLSGATISSKTSYAVSDDNGYFEIALQSLEDIIQIRFLGYKTIERQAKFFSFESCETLGMIEHKENINTVTVKAYLVRGIDKTQEGSTVIDYEKFTLLPGLIESDVLQTVQALPGVNSVDETVSNINIRGGSHDQNLILWDDIKMYQSGHFFGLISSFNPSMTQSAKLINNGSDVSLTDGVSGTIHMTTKEQVQSDFSGNFDLNFINANLFANIPTGNKSSLQIAGRKSLDDLLRTPTYEVYFDRVTQDTEVADNATEVSNSNQNFDFYDTSLRWLYTPTDKDKIRLNFLLINNNLSFDETALLNNVLQTRESSVSQNSLVFGLNYQRQWSEHLSTVFSVYNTEYLLEAINANILQQQRFLQENSVSETGLRLEGLYNMDRFNFKLGYALVENEVVNLNDIDVPRFVRRDSEVLREHAGFGQIHFQNENNDFSAKVGVRVNYISEFNELIVEPRLNVRKAIGEHIEIEALGEFKHQNTSQIINFQNDFLGIEKRRWQLTDNDSIPILKSKQASIGILFKNKGWLLDAKAFYKTVDGITTQSQSFTTKYEFTRAKGSYDAYGAEFLLRKQFKNFDSWLSYSYIDNTYNFETLEGEFPSNFDITHSITFGSTYSNDTWKISAGLNYRTGKPTSIPIEGNEVLNNEVNFDAANSERLDNYLRIDASAMYKFKISNTFRSEIGVSVWNVSNKENIINQYYRINTDNQADQFSRFSLGLTTNAVIKLYF